MVMNLEAVKLQSRKVRGIDTYLVTVPKRFIEELGWSKGTLLKVYIEERDGRKVLIYEKVEI